MFLFDFVTIYFYKLVVSAMQEAFATISNHTIMETLGVLLGTCINILFSSAYDQLSLLVICSSIKTIWCLLSSFVLLFQM